MPPASPILAESARREGVPTLDAAAGEFRLRLHHEQERADRHGHALSLLVLRSRAKPAPSGWLEPTLAAARARRRSTDAVGVLREDAAGVLLTFSGAEEAGRLGQALQLELERAGLAVETEVQLLRPQLGAQRARRRTEPEERTETASACTGTDTAGEGADVRWEPRGLQPLLARPLPRWKRAVDVALALTGIALLAPLMALIALLVLVTSGRPVLYRHERTGLGLRRFDMLKFRTMRNSAARGWEDVAHLNEMSGLLFKSDKDPRVLRFGKFLRKTSLDELPQLINVLRGDMTLIGPRALSPHPMKYEPWQLARFDVTPGIACTWQAESRDDTDFTAWMRRDLEYVVRGTTLRGDLAILVRVLWSVIRCRGGR